MFGEGEVNSSTYGKWQLQCEPTVSFTMLRSNKTVVIDQNAKGFGELGTHIWDAGLVLARFLEIDGLNDSSARSNEEKPFCYGKRCIELGSGTGLTGTVAALLGADITLTDKPALLQLIRHNIEKNTGHSAKVTISDLYWGETNPFKDSFDVVLGADLTYEMEDVPILVNQIRALIDHHSVVILAYGIERAAMELFFEYSGQYFTFEFIPQQLLNDSDVKYPISTIGIVKMRLK